MDVDRPVGDEPVGQEAVIALRRVHDLLAGEDPSGPSRQEDEDAELGGGELDGMAEDDDLMTAGVDDEIADGDRGRV